MRNMVDSNIKSALDIYEEILPLSGGPDIHILLKGNTNGPSSGECHIGSVMHILGFEALGVAHILKNYEKMIFFNLI